MSDCGGGLGGGGECVVGEGVCLLSGDGGGEISSSQFKRSRVSPEGRIGGFRVEVC